MAAKAGRLQIQLEMQVAQLQRDLDKANRAIDSSAKKWAQSFANVASVFAGAFLAGAAQQAIAGLSQALDNVMQRFDDIADGAKRVGIGTEAFQELAYAAGQSGLEMAELEKALARMQKGFGTGAESFQKALANIGLSFDELSKMGDAERFTAIVDALGKVEDNGKRAANGAAIFGKGVAALGPLMAEGAEGIEAMIQKAHELGIILDGETVAAGEAFNDQMETMQLQLQAVVAKGLGPLLPQLTVLSEEFGKAAVEMLGAENSAEAFRIMADAVANSLAFLTNMTIQAAAGVKALAQMMKASSEVGVSLLATGDPFTGFKHAAMENERTVKEAERIYADMMRRLEALRAGRDTQVIASSVNFVDGKFVDATNTATEATEENTKSVQRNTAARAKAVEQKQAEFDLDKLMSDVQKRADEQMARTNDLLTQRELARAEFDGATRDELELLQLKMEGYNESQLAIAAETQAIRNATEERAQLVTEQARMVEDYQQTLVHGFDDIFYSMTQGSDEAQAAVARLVTELAAMYLQMVALNALKQFNAGGSWGFQGVAKGGAFDQNGMMAFAQGGIVRSPTAFTFGGGRLGVMGEAGPEAILPLGRDSMGRLGVRGGGVNINVHNNVGAQVSVDRRGDDIAIIIDQVRGVIANDLSRGGNVVTTALEGAYGVRR